MAKEVRIKEKSWIARIAASTLKSKNAAIVFGDTIHLHGVSVGQFLQDERWVAHELKHVSQYEKLGFMGFILLYVKESIANGYYNNRLEKEARSAEKDTRMLKAYDLSAYTNKA